jgi:hypothetical protein
MDLFAEDTETRTVVEIQKVDYDYTYDRFTHYFIGNLIELKLKYPKIKLNLRKSHLTLHHPLSISQKKAFAQAKAQ